MKWFSKKKKSKPVYYNIAPGDLVELTIVGRWDGRAVSTPAHSYFSCGAGNRQVDPDVWIRSLEEEQGD